MGSLLIHLGTLLLRWRLAWAWAWALEDDGVPAGSGVESSKPLLARLEPGMRAKVLAALAALIILGFLLMFLAWLGARATRRYMRRPPLLLEKTRTTTNRDDWATKPLGDRPSETDTRE